MRKNLGSLYLPSDNSKPEVTLKFAIRRIRDYVAENGLSGASEFAYVKEELSKLPDEQREPCEFLYFQGHSVGVARIEAKYTVQLLDLQREKRYFWTSLAMLVVLIVLSLIVPEPTAWQMTVLRLVMALAAASFVAFLPGMLMVEGALAPNSVLGKASVKATGALGAFVLVYLYAPALMRH